MMKHFLAVSAASTLVLAGLVFGETPDPQKGKLLFDGKAEPACAVCHNATSTEKKMGPGLKGISQKAKFTNGKKMSDAALKENILKGGGGMPGYEDTLKAADIANLVAYLKTL